MLEKMYSPKEVSEKLGVCRKTVLRRIKDGSIPSIKIGTRDIRIKESDVLKYLEPDTQH